MLAQQAIARAYREAAIKPIGTVPTVEEYTEGLERLNGFLDSLFGAEISEQLSDIQVPRNLRATTNAADPIALSYPDNLTAFNQPGEPASQANDTGQVTIPPNSRIVWGGTTATTIYLPEYPQDGARLALASVGATATLTLNANGRLIEGATTRAIPTTTTTGEWFYRADTANWVAIAPLELTSESPLPATFDRLLVTGTAIALTALDEIKVSSGTMFTYERLLKLCKQRYAQNANTTYGGQNLVPSDQAYDTFGAFGALSPWR